MGLTMPHSFDVLVIGAGAAGSVAALNLARKGHQVLVLEKLDQLGAHNQTKIDVTENIGLDPVFHELKLPYLGKFNTSKWYSPKHHFYFESKVYDYYMLRGPSPNSFDVQVMESAQNAGAELWLNAEPTKFNFKNDLIESIDIRCGSNHFNVQPKYVLGADGLNSATLLHTQLSREEIPGVELIGYGVVCRGLEMPPNETHVLFDADLAPGGYFYMGSTKDGLGLASVVINKSKQSGKSMKLYYEDFVRWNPHVNLMMKKVEVLNTFVGAGKTGVLRRRSQGNLALIGDAGRTMDPIFGYGVRQAIASAYLASNLVHENMEKNIPHLNHYDYLLRENLLLDEGFGHFVRKVLDKLDNDDLDYVVEFLAHLHSNAHLDEVLDNPLKHLPIILGALMRHPYQNAKIAIKGMV